MVIDIMKQEWKQDVRHNELLPSAVVLAVPCFLWCHNFLTPFEAGRIIFKSNTNRVKSFVLSLQKTQNDSKWVKCQFPNMWFNSLNEVSDLVYLCLKKSKMNILKSSSCSHLCLEHNRDVEIFESFRMGKLTNCKDLLKLCFVATFRVNNT